MVAKTSKHEGIRYSAVGDSTVHFPAEGPSICCKAFVSLVTLALLITSLTVIALLFKSDDFIVRLNLDDQKTLLYRFEQRCELHGSGSNHRSLTSLVSVQTVNRTATELWIYMKITFTTQKSKQVQDSLNSQFFLVHFVNENTKPVEQPKTAGRYQIYGDLKTGPEFIHYVENVVKQLFPEVQVKLYGMALGGKSGKQTRKIDRSPFVSSSVNVHHEVKREKGSVFLESKFNEDDFVGFLSDEYGDGWAGFWSVAYYEKATVVEKTGVLTEGRMDLNVVLPLSGHHLSNDDESRINNFTIKLSSNVVLLHGDDKGRHKWTVEAERRRVNNFQPLKWNYYTNNPAKVSRSNHSLRDKARLSSSNVVTAFAGDTSITTDGSELIYQPPTGSSANNSDMLLFDLKELIRTPASLRRIQWPKFVALLPKDTPEQTTTEQKEATELWSDSKGSDSDTEDDMDDEDVETKAHDNFDYDDSGNVSPPLFQDEDQNEDDSFQNPVNLNNRKKPESELSPFSFPLFPPLPPLLPSVYPFDEDISNGRRSKRSLVSKTTENPIRVGLGRLRSFRGLKRRGKRFLSQLPKTFMKEQKLSRKAMPILSTGNSDRRGKRSSSSELKDIWDIASDETSGPKIRSKRTIEIFRRPILGMDVSGEVQHEIISRRAGSEEETWQVVQTVYFNVGRYRFTVLRKKHRIGDRLRSKLIKRRTRRYLVSAGDLVRIESFPINLSD